MSGFTQKSTTSSNARSQELEDENSFTPLPEWPPHRMSVSDLSNDSFDAASLLVSSVVGETASSLIPNEALEKLPVISSGEPFAMHEDFASVISHSSKVTSTLSSNARSTPSPTRLMPMHEYCHYNSLGLPIADGASVLAPSLRMGSSFTQSSQRSASVLGKTNTDSESVGSLTWTEATEVDLVMNVGQRERTRQEVLWEIVASEQRYVLELLKLKETFIDPLLHPFLEHPTKIIYDQDTPSESIDDLPIASRFLDASSIRSRRPLSPTASTLSSGTIPFSTTASSLSSRPSAFSPTPSTLSNRTFAFSPTPSFASSTSVSHNLSSVSDNDLENAIQIGPGRKIDFAPSPVAKSAHSRSYGTAIRSGLRAVIGKTKTQSTARSHQSLPPSARVSIQSAASTTSLGRKSEEMPSTAELEARLAKRKALTEGLSLPASVSPNVLPEDLRKCLEVIDKGILIGHLRLSEALQKRYDQQFPLVRSLADVFVANSDILNEYALYVLHLERALEQVDEAMNKPTKQAGSSDEGKLIKLLQYLDKLASDKGETGLAISLSKPFQRLICYPLLFQNLLFHTDPSTFEYESTLRMVAEVETIIRSIGDEKVQKEERDKTRDVFARIDHLGKELIFAIFKPSRILVQEIQYSPSNNDEMFNSTSRGSVRPKASFRRLGGILPPDSETRLGSKKDLWLVVFNDVVLLCQRTGTTTLPLSITSPNSVSGGKLSARSRRRVNPRNLYRFIKVQNWTINSKPKSRDLVLKEDIQKWRNQQANSLAPDDSDKEEIESDDSDRNSQMSFSYWGADKVTLSKPHTTPQRDSFERNHSVHPTKPQSSRQGLQVGSQRAPREAALSWASHESGNSPTPSEDSEDSGVNIYRQIMAQGLTSSK